MNKFDESRRITKEDWLKISKPVYSHNYSIRNIKIQLQVYKKQLEKEGKNEKEIQELVYNKFIDCV